MANRASFAPFPDDPNDPRYVQPLFTGDSYRVRTADGQELWANFEPTGFVPCDDDGAAVGAPVEVATVETRVRA